MEMIETKKTAVEELPIVNFHDEIMACNAPYIIVEAETGSGKSTMVPQWFYEAGQSVLVTEPLIETVIGTSEYVAEMMGHEIGGVVGYRTGEYKCDSHNTKILYCTDALALVRELSHHNRFDILVLDELHQWNLNQSTLEAWAWKHLCDGDTPFKKIIALSATMDSQKLSAKRNNAPIFKVPGRQFPIVDRQVGDSIESDIRWYVANGYDVLCFQPGKSEIAKTISQLEGLDAELFPFHSELERGEKDRAYRSYQRPKVVVSTNSLETGRTLLPSLAIGQKLAVVDSGMERRMEVIDGIETLVLAPISQAQSKQRRGRTGRVSDGAYSDHCPTSNRPEYPVPEILRTRLDQTVLRLAVAGYDATELPFFHEVLSDSLVEAHRSLKALGAMEEDGSINAMGRFMARMPVSVQYARMVYEAIERGVIDDVLTVTAILEQGGLRDRSENWRSLTSETKSDLLAELDFWNAARNMRGDEMREKGIFAKAYFQAKQSRDKMRDALRSQGIRDFRSTGNREDILKSCVAGMVDHLYHSIGGGEYRNGGSDDRQKARESVVSGGPEWITGIPKNIQFKNRRGYLCTMKLVSMITATDPMWLAEVAPQLVKTEIGLAPNFDAEQDSVASVTKVHFNGQLVKEERVADTNHHEAPAVFASWLAGRMVI